MAGAPSLAARKTPEGRAAHNARAREYHARNKDRLNRLRRERHLLSRYGLTPEAFDRLLERQGGGCAICAVRVPPRGWHVDHDHKCCPFSSRSCGKCLRGILCGPCNKGLGAFKDEPAFLERAALYVARGGSL